MLADFVILYITVTLDMNCTACIWELPAVCQELEREIQL